LYPKTPIGQGGKIIKSHKAPLGCLILGRFLRGGNLPDQDDYG